MGFNSAFKGLINALISYKNTHICRCVGSGQSIYEYPTNDGSSATCSGKYCKDDCTVAVTIVFITGSVVQFTKKIQQDATAYQNFYFIFI